MGEYQGKVVLITGSSAGIGAGIAVHMAGLGARVSITGRDQSKLEGVSKRCIEAGLKPEGVVTTAGDLKEEAFRERLVARTIDTLGRLDVLVNNAGVGAGGSLTDAGMTDYLAVLDLNLHAHVAMCKLATPALLKTSGSIINISSNFGLRPVPGMGAYCMSKAALDMFTKVLALELAPKGVRVNSVNPGVVRSEILRSRMAADQYEEFLQHTGKLTPVGRVGEPEDVARAVAFLASPNASFIVGELLVLDGAGRYAALQ